MKHFLLIITISLATAAASAQDAIDYYSKINEGKLFAIDNDFESAVRSYQEVFEGSDFSFARDCYNAVELSILAKDSARLAYFVEVAMTRGIRLEDLEEGLSIRDYLEVDIYENLLRKEDSLLSVYDSRINQEIRTEITQMFLEDQEMREAYYGANIFRRKKTGKKWEALNAAQVERIIEITKAYGFPGEKLIGLDRTEMHSKVETSNYSAGMPIVILIHHYSQPNPPYDHLLLEEVQKGNLHNEHFATICDFEAEFGKDRYDNLGYYGLRHRPKEMDEDNLNIKRGKIGILELGQVEKLNRVAHLTRFWNMLY